MGCASDPPFPIPLAGKAYNQAMVKKHSQGLNILLFLSDAASTAVA